MGLGPGSYDPTPPPSHFNNAKFGSVPRFKYKKDRCDPIGPGAYDVISLFILAQSLLCCFTRRLVLKSTDQVSYRGYSPFQ